MFLKILTIDLAKTNIFPDANLSGTSGDIIPSSVYNIQTTGAATGFNPFTTAGTFVPHTMYDPVTGIGYSANTYEEHLLYESLGYVHTRPTVSAGTSASGSSFGAGGIVSTGTSGSTSTTTTTPKPASGTACRGILI